MLLAVAQQTAGLRWQSYEEMAALGAEDFPADARKED
jgi:hypothetical protein